MSNLARSVTDIAVASPYVIASRLASFMAPDALLSPRNQHEVATMILEKQFAAVESLTSMSLAYQNSMLSFWFNALSGQRSTQSLDSAANSFAKAALAPYRRRVTSNARRLKRRKL